MSTITTSRPATMAELQAEIDRLHAGHARIYDDAQKQKHRADALAATIRALLDVVTHDAETKADFIARVRAILSADPDARVTPNAEFSARPKSGPLE